MPLSYRDYTVACICPMGLTLAPVRALLDQIHPSQPTQRGQNSYVLGAMGGHNIVIAVLPEIGTNSAVTVATQLLNDFPSVRFGLLVGIGGGVPDLANEIDIRLGDIVVSKPTKTSGGVVQYDMGKETPNGFERTGTLNKPPAILRAAVQQLAAQHELEDSHVPLYLSGMLEKFSKMREKYTHPGAEHDQLFATAYEHQGGKTCASCDSSQVIRRAPRPSLSPFIHYGTIGSANRLIKNAAEREKLKSSDMDIMCVEMEAASLMDSFPCLVIRGICDYADSHKNKKWQPYAAATAAAYMKEILSVIPAQEVSKTPHATRLVQNPGDKKSLDFRGVSEICEDLSVDREACFQDIESTPQLQSDSSDSMVEQCDQGAPDKLQDQEDATQMPEIISSNCVSKAKVEKENWILEKLKFPEMRRRENAIEHAHAGSYRWLLYDSAEPDKSPSADPTSLDSPDKKDVISILKSLNDIMVKNSRSFNETSGESQLKAQTRTRFLGWLESGSGIFYLSGKPGSGKSTMMKFLTREERTGDLLKAWAAGKQLVFASFFFWSSGLKLQRSIEGLYRGLLWETLKACPELMPSVFPRMWDHGSGHLMASMSDIEFLFTEIEEAFARLTNASSNLPCHRICFFIDGLDEFEGDHWKLANLLKEWTSSPNVKICVSSRPYTDFENSFITRPDRCLRLHELTYQDMIQVAKGEFESDQRLLRLSRDVPDYIPLIKSAVEKSNGVFLWLRLATRYLLRGIGNQYSASQLAEILQSMPEDVFDMFQKMLDKLLTRPDRVRVAITLLYLCDPTLPKVYHEYVIYFSVMDDFLDRAIDMDDLLRGSICERYSHDQIEQRISTTEARLRGRCEDFIDIQDNRNSKTPLPLQRYVEFMHRDLRDFLVQDHILKKLYKTAGWSRLKVAGLHRYLGLVLLKMVPSIAHTSGLIDRLIDEFYNSETTSAAELELLLDIILKAPVRTTETARRYCTVLALQSDIPRQEIEKKVYYSTPGSLDRLLFALKFISAAAFHRHDEYVLRRISRYPNLLELQTGTNILLSASLGGAGAHATHLCPDKTDTSASMKGFRKTFITSDAVCNLGAFGGFLCPKSPVDLFPGSVGDPGFQMEDFKSAEGSTPKLRKGTTEPLALARSLLQKGASPNAKLKCEIPVWQGSYWTPWTATLFGVAAGIRKGEFLDVLPEILELYLSHGADPTICFVGRYAPKHKLKEMPVWRVGPGIYCTIGAEEYVPTFFENDNWYYLTLSQVVELLEHPKQKAIADLLLSKSPWAVSKLVSQAAASLRSHLVGPCKISNLVLKELGDSYFFTSMIVRAHELNGLKIPDSARGRLLPTSLIPI